MIVQVQRLRSKAGPINGFGALRMDQPKGVQKHPNHANHVKFTAFHGRRTSCEAYCNSSKRQLVPSNGPRSFWPQPLQC